MNASRLRSGKQWLNGQRGASLARLCTKALSAVVVWTTMFAGSASQAAPESFAGYWYGERDYPDDWHVQWLIDRRADGAFKLVFVEYHQCEKARIVTNEGHWTLVDDLYVTVTDKRNGIASRERFAYRVELLTDGEMHFHHIESGRLHIGRKVTKNFQFPPPPCRSISLRQNENTHRLWYPDPQVPTARCMKGRVRVAARSA